MRSILTALAVLAVAAAGCQSNEGGMGLPQQRDGEIYPGDRHQLVGVLEAADNGCLNLNVLGTTRLVIWPAGSRQDELVRLPNGDVIAEGDEVAAIGAVTPTGPLVGDGGGYWASTLGFCAPDAADVLVLDEARLGP